jgi:hypothetical protein
MAHFNDHDAEVAIDVATPLVEKILKKRWIRHRSFHLIISQREPDGKYTLLAEKSFGKPAACKRYKFIAEGKTELSARTGLSSREVQLMRPDLLESFDIMFWGSAIEGDIIVAGSGVQPWVDEAIAKSCLAICMALIQQKIETQRENARATSTNFVWD